MSLLGDVALGPDGMPALHPHVVVSRADGFAMGGHLLEAHVRPTLEVVLTESPKLSPQAKGSGNRACAHRHVTANESEYPLWPRARV